MDIIKRATREIIASRGDCTYFQFSHDLIQKLACFITIIANNLGSFLKLHFKSAHMVIPFLKFYSYKVEKNLKILFKKLCM